MNAFVALDIGNILLQGARDCMGSAIELQIHMDL
jgi:hypothetical protein